MCKRAETFNAKKGYKLAIFVLNQLLCFQNRNLWNTFQTLFLRKRGLAHPYFLYENELLQHFLPYDIRDVGTFLGLEVWIFKRVRFLRAVRFSSGPGSRSGSGFQTTLLPNPFCAISPVISVLSSILRKMLHETRQLCNK